MIVLGPDWRPESMSPGVEEWLRDLPDGNWAASNCRLLCSPWRTCSAFGHGHRRPRRVAVARVLTRSGRWVVLHGVPLAATTVNGLPSSSNLPTQAGLPATDVGLWPDRTGAAIDQTRVAGLLDPRDR